VTLLAAAMVAVAVLVLAQPRPTARQRVRAVAPLTTRTEHGSMPGPSPFLRRPVLLAGLGGAGLLLVTGLGRWTLPIVGVGLVAAVRSRRPPAAPTELPLVVDLLASSLRGGALMPAGLETATGAAGPELGRLLASVAGALRSGAEATEAWAEIAADSHLAPVARICTRVGGSGASCAVELERLSRRLRTARRSDLDARAARAAVWVVMPLCLCFLPAFVLVGVVPMAVSLLQSLR
jgi:Flp pilus assembly protein TadB